MDGDCILLAGLNGLELCILLHINQPIDSVSDKNNQMLLDIAL